MVSFLKNYQFTFDFTSTYVPFKRRKDLRRKVVDNGGIISYILNKQTKFLVSGNKDITETYKGRAALKLGIPIVSLAFVDDCIEKQKVLDSEEYLVAGNTSAKQFSCGIIKVNVDKSKEINSRSKALSSVNLRATRVYMYKDEQNTDVPFFPTNYEIIKHAWFKKVEKNGICHFFSVELHVAVLDNAVTIDNEDLQQTFRIFTHLGIMDKRGVKDGKKECRFASEPNDAEQLYALLCRRQYFHQQFSAFPPWVGSDKMLLTNFENESFDKENSISSAVTSLVHTLWSEAVGELTSLLAVPAEKINMGDIDKAEAVLLLLREMMNAGPSSREEHKKLSDDFYSLIPHNAGKLKNIDTKRVLVEKQDLCQLIKDMVNVSEATNFSNRSSDEAKYRALRCRLEVLSKSTDEYQNILNSIRSTQYSGNGIKVENIFSCNRPIESSNFSCLGNKRQLFHSSRAQNFLGILSRGLLPPKLVVEDYGGQRTDIGKLGAGIYFASSAGASVRYSTPGQVRGSRFMLICDVALGNVKDYTEFSTELNSPPEGYNSCHGLRRRDGEIISDFEDDEYVIYAVNQQMIRYLVEFSLPEDNVRSLSRELLGVTLNVPKILSEPTNAPSLDEKDVFSSEEVTPDLDITDVENIEDPLSKVKAGLKYEGETLVPLQSVHIRAKLLDLCAKVVVMQVYKNPRPEPIEAKYVFPLDDMAAVCGFEAFINGKHIIGEVKEKEQAHKEYKRAINEGHGAYLMDEETPDVFTVSVGNIPSGASVLIKISYVAELPVEADSIRFNLPGSLAPWKRSEALEDVTQDVVESVKVDDDLACELSVRIAVEMPYDIRKLECPTHEIRIKKTATKAVVVMREDQTLRDGFQLLIGLAEIHVPRMWVERHPKKPDSQACMLSFYPEFEAQSTSNVELIFLLDLSCSMLGTPLDNAKKILLLALHNLPENSRFNIVGFGGHWVELFPTSVLRTDKNLKEAADFVKRRRGSMGCSELWKVLKGLTLLPVKAGVDMRNICIISDCHVSEEDTTLKLISTNRHHSRIFTFGVGSTANRYFMRVMAQVGAGSSEYFEPKMKSKWKRKVQSQLEKCQQPVLTSVSVTWQQFGEGAPKPIQAPNQILSLFNGSRQVVYGFVPFCTQATLKAEIKRKEISTMVSSSELSITTGETLHQLTARAVINDWDEGLLADDQLQHQIVKSKQKSYIIEISKEYSVTSKFTSFVAIEHRDESEKLRVDSTPNIHEILNNEDVDILPYITWEEADDGILKGLGEFPEDDMETEDKLYRMVDLENSQWEECSEGEAFPMEGSLPVPDFDKDNVFTCMEDDECDVSVSVEDSSEASQERFYKDSKTLYKASLGLCGTSEESYEACERLLKAAKDVHGIAEESSITVEEESYDDVEFGLDDNLSSQYGAEYKKVTEKSIKYCEKVDDYQEEECYDSTEAYQELLYKVSERYKAAEDICKVSEKFSEDSKTFSSAPKGLHGVSEELCQTFEELSDDGEMLGNLSPFFERAEKKKKRSKMRSEKCVQLDGRRGADFALSRRLSLSSDISSDAAESCDEQISSSPGYDVTIQAPSMDHVTIRCASHTFGLPPSPHRPPMKCNPGGLMSPVIDSAASGSGPSSFSGELENLCTYGTRPRLAKFVRFSEPGSPSWTSHEGTVHSRSAPATSEVSPPPLPPKQAMAPGFGYSGRLMSRSKSFTEAMSCSFGSSILLSSSSQQPAPSLLESTVPVPPPSRKTFSSLFGSAATPPPPSNRQVSFSIQSTVPPPPPPMSKQTNSFSFGSNVPPPPLASKDSVLFSFGSSVPGPSFASKEPALPSFGSGTALFSLPSEEHSSFSCRSASQPRSLQSEEPASFSYGFNVPSPPPTEESGLRKFRSNVPPPSAGSIFSPNYQPTSPGFICPNVRRVRSISEERRCLESGDSNGSIRRLPEILKEEPVSEQVIVKLFELQSNEGSWNIPDSNLDIYLGIDTKKIVRLLKDSGAMSLGPPVFSMVSKILATLLVLAFLRNHFQQFFPLYLLPPFRPRRKLEETGTSWQNQTEKALTWLMTADKLVPCLYTRLQLGISWEDVVPKLLKLPSKSDV